MNILTITKEVTSESRADLSLGKGRALGYQKPGAPKMLFINQMHIKCGHVNGCCLRSLSPQQLHCVCVERAYCVFCL